VEVLTAFLIGILTALLSVLCVWGVWLAGAGFNNPIWILVAMILALGAWAVFGVARAAR
jgi:hypothetical protein